MHVKVRWMTFGHFNDRNAKRPDICFLIVADLHIMHFNIYVYFIVYYVYFLNDFWCEKEWRADDGVAFFQSISHFTFVSKKKKAY